MLFLAAALAIGAQTQGPRPEVEELARTERAFAGMAAQQGNRPAFLHYFRRDAVNYGAAGLQNAYEALLQAPVSKRTSRLIWAPVWADVSSSVDLGYTFGPYHVERLSDGKPIEGLTGSFFSIWKRRMGEPWRVALDIGVPGPEYPAERLTFQGAAAVMTPLHGQPNLANMDDLAVGGLSEDTPAPWLLRAGALPVRSGSIPDLIGRRYVGGGASRAGDLAYTYGIYGEPVAGAYVRVYRRNAKGTWTVAADVLHPKD